jgi:putative endonuclease
LALSGRPAMKTYSVYIMASKSLNLYTGVTSNLQRRVWQHREKIHKGFSAKYNTNRLVYYESFGGILAAIRREKEIKGWLRCKKIALIESTNLDWKDLSKDW